MNNQKPESLFQSMEKWIDLYRELHECSHNEAHDAFEDWAEKLRGESADQTTKLFHEAVKASYQEMKAKTDKGIIILHGDTEPKPVSYTNTKGETVTSKPARNLFGGPLLETGKDPLAFKDGYNPENVHWGQATVYHKDESVLNGVIAQGSMDKLAHGEPFQPSFRMIQTPAELRANLEKAISDANKYLDELGDVGHPSDLARAKEVKELAEGRLKMLDELEAREKERSGRRLSLVRK